jgi:hypothetical protein
MTWSLHHLLVVSKNNQICPKSVHTTSPLCTILLPAQYVRYDRISLQPFPKQPTHYTSIRDLTVFKCVREIAKSYY